MAEAHDEEPDAISTKKLFEDVEQPLIAWNVMFKPDATLDYYASSPKLPELRARLAELLGSTWCERWRASPPQERHKKTPKKNARTHNSVYRILKKYQRKKKRRPAKET